MTSPPDTAANSPWRGVAYFVAGAAVAAGVVWLLMSRDDENGAPGKDNGPSAQRLLTDARQAVADDDFARARQLADQALEKTPDSVDALLIAGESAEQLGQFDEAVGYWQRIPKSSGKRGAAALLRAGQVLLEQLHRATDAERMFRRAAAMDPDLDEAVQQLANLLATEGRRSEAVPLILDLFRRGKVAVDHVALLGMPLGTINNPDLIKACHVADRQDPGLLLGVAASTTFNLPPERARPLLAEAVRRAPELVEAQFRLGTILLEAGDESEFLAWHDALPPEAGEHAEIWALRGKWAQAKGEAPVATRCYWEAVRRDSNHHAALYQLGQMLLRAGNEQAAAALIERGEKLQQLREMTDVLLHTDQQSLEPMRKVAEMLAALDRPWEAWGWCQVVLQYNKDEPWAKTLAAKLAPLLGPDTPLTLAAASPVSSLDLSDHPLPDWKTVTIRVDGNSQLMTPIRFTENAAAVKLDFTYYNHPRETAEGKRMYEFPGGGLGVLDYDADGWPDVFFTQGCQWPLDPSQRQHLDRLFRNVGGRQFEDVTESTGLVEPSFSHGVSVGDFDNDGFPDLYVANIGRNRLFQNNGDGTFTDVSDRIAGDAARWTTNTLVADLNGDGLPDLYDANYAAAEDVFERICKHADGKPRMCMPFHFPAAPDQLYLNQGDGRFVDATQTSGIAGADGRGLGIVCGDLLGDGRTCVFVANDTTRNFLFLPPESAARESAPDASNGGPLFEERGVLSGVALNGQGRAEGCMGVAAGDVNGDGRIDLFIGNFLRETNTLYVQEPGRLFADATAEFGLANPSLDLLAFGTQFLDPDLDGDLDLIVANGHVDDVRAYGRPYHMRPQFFENPGKGALVERGGEVSKFFEQEFLARALVTWDWNGDGREDVLVSNLDAPASLLTNGSAGGGVLAVRLRGTASSRDAIGATATVRVGERTLTRQLTAGNGYQCSNQRRLVFGLGPAAQVDELTVRWPSGVTTRYEQPPLGHEVLIVEGAHQPLWQRDMRTPESSSQPSR